MIRISNVDKIYGSGNLQVHALKNVSLEVADGEFVAVVGASGSGKSTLMNIIGCLDFPSSGEYLLNGVNVSELSGRELSRLRSSEISFIFQSFNLIPTLTARENIELPLIYRKTGKASRRSLAQQALEAVGLSDRAGHYPWQLSGGQQQRVAVARALAANAPLILADEPCGNLDREAGAAVMDMLRLLNKAGKTVLLITHDPKAAASASRCVTISDGRLQA